MGKIAPSFALLWLELPSLGCTIPGLQDTNASTRLAGFTHVRRNKTRTSPYKRTNIQTTPRLKKRYEKN